MYLCIENDILRCSEKKRHEAERRLIGECKPLTIDENRQAAMVDATVGNITTYIVRQYDSLYE